MSTDSFPRRADHRRTEKQRGGERGETGAPSGPLGGTDEPLLRVKDLVKYYPTERKGFLGARRGAIKAVDGVSFDLYPRRDARAGGRNGLWKIHHCQNSDAS